MLKLLTAVCFGAVAISLAMTYDGLQRSFISKLAPNPSSLHYRSSYFQDNKHLFSPQEKDWSSPFKPNAFSDLKNTGRVPIIQRPHIRQMDVPNAIPINPPIYPYREMQGFQNSPNQQQPSHCENSELLFKIITIFLHLLDIGGEVNNPDIEKVNLAVKLLKEYLKTAPRDVQNFEVADKLLTLEVALLQNRDTQQSNQEKKIPATKRSFGIFDDNIAPAMYTNDAPSHRLPIPHIPYKRANFNNIQNLNAKNNEALKSSMELLMNHSDYNARAVFELLQSFKPQQPTESPVDALEPVFNDAKPFNPDQTELNSNLLAYETNYNNSQLSDNVAINDWNYSKAAKIDPLNPNEIELIYALKRPQPLVYQPYYFIKYRLPFITFLQNLGKVTQMKSSDTPKSELYKSVIQNWNADEMSPDLAHFTKEQVNDLVIKEGNLVEALLIQSKDKNMRINLNTPENLETQLSEYNIARDNTETDVGNPLIKEQARPSYSSDHNDESRRRNVESNIRPGLDTPPRFPGYHSMFQKGPPPTPLKSYSDHLLYKSGFGKTLPAAHLPSSLIETDPFLNRG